MKVPKLSGAATLTMLHAIFLAEVMLAGWAAYLLVWSILAPKDTLAEFLANGIGLTSSLAVAASWCGSTVLFLIFGSSVPMKAIRSWVATKWLRDSVRSAITVGALSVCLTVAFVAQAVIAGREGHVDRIVNQSLTYLLAGRHYEAQVAIDSLIPEKRRNSYDAQSIALASVGLEVATAASDNNRDHQWWVRQRVRVESWLKQNDRMHFLCDVMLAKICFRIREVQTAASHLAAAAAHPHTNEQNVILQFFRGEVLIETGDFCAAEVAFRDGLQEAEVTATPVYRAELYNRVAICCYQQRKWQEAEVAIHAAIDVNPNARPLLLSNYGLIALLAGKPKAAVDALTEAVTLDPNDAVAQMNLGICHTVAANWSAARDALRQARTVLDKSANPKQRAADFRLIGLLEAWLSLRSQAPLAAVIDAGRVALGHSSDLESAKSIASDDKRAGEYCERLGRQVINDQHFYGLEFVAADFLRHAARLNQEGAPALKTLLESLPASATGSEVTSTHEAPADATFARGVDAAQGNGGLRQ